MTDRYVTIVGFNNYYGNRPFAIGTTLLCEKEPNNACDSEAIKAVFPFLGTVGYVANSVHTRANGTLSAGRIYELVGDRFLVEVAFTTGTKVITRVVNPNVGSVDFEYKIRINAPDHPFKEEKPANPGGMFDDVFHFRGSL